ncbi:MAG: MFS transporter [Chloroflexi bacterium]|nr:MFS transporter [Chloroflexota bacterium]
MTTNRPSGMRGFTILWLGQIVSLLGSAMTWFAFTIWAWKTTGSVASLSILSFFAFLPSVLLAPLAGTFVDRWNRKLVMMFSDAATAIGTLTVLILYATDNLQLWHIYIVGILAGFFTAFQYPAYTAAMTTMLPKDQYARAEGMLGLAAALSGILAPVFAAALLGKIGMTGIMLIDLVTFLAAFGSLLWIHIPKPATSEVGLKSRGTVWQETRFGFQYIWERPNFLGLAMLFMAANVFLAIGATLIAPLILSGTGNSESALATVQSTGAVGGVVGGGLLSLWGGPRRRIHGVLLGGIGACLLGVVWLGLGRAILVWSIGSFFFSFFEPFVESGNLAIWQSKVEADVQGRVLSAQHLLVRVPYLLGILLAGLLAERWSISNVLAAAGIGGALVFLSGYVFRAVHEAEILLPDAQNN